MIALAGEFDPAVTYALVFGVGLAANCAFMLPVATPPNLIHSLDASHLTLTLKKCRDQGLNQVTMIHDSYGSLVAQMPLMQKLLRESFVEMYNSWDVCDEFLRDASMVVPEGAL